MTARAAGNAAFYDALRHGATVHDAERAAFDAYTRTMRRRAQIGQ